MTTRHLSVRLDDGTFARLEERSRRTGQSRSILAKTLLEEGLRMEAHPGIVFRPGPAGRRAGIAGGPDVWEIVRVLRATTGDVEDRLRMTAALIDLAPAKIAIATGYYAEFRGEIDTWIRQVDEEAEQAEIEQRRISTALEQ